MNTNILNQQQCSQLRSLIDEAESIVICCHVSPDGDAIGAILGWAEYLRSLGKDNVKLIVPDMFPDYLQWMPGTETIIRHDKRCEEAEAYIGDSDLIFCMDFNGYLRLDRLAGAVENAHAKRVLIDHHPHPTIPCVLTVSHPEMSSTCELVMRIVCQMGGFDSLDRLFAVPIYCGMMTDTGGFTYNSSTPEIFYLISLLLTKGIDKDKIYRNVYNNFSENRLRLVGHVLKDRLVVRRHSAYFILTRQDLADYHFIKGDAEGIVNMPLQIKGLRLSISLREDTEKDNKVLVSLRSIEPHKCNDIAAKFFNGGGHDYAAGGRLMCTMDEAVKTAEAAIDCFEKRFS